MTMALTKAEIDQIAERWSAEHWDEHERAFARQWMAQAQEDIAVLVEALEEASEGALDLHRSISQTVRSIEGKPKDDSES